MYIYLFNLSSFQDPATKYHGHLLLAHIIAKFAIHKRIVLQVCMQCHIFIISPSLSLLTFPLYLFQYTVYVHVHVFPLMPILGVPQSPQGSCHWSPANCSPSTQYTNTCCACENGGRKCESVHLLVTIDSILYTCCIVWAYIRIVDSIDGILGCLSSPSLFSSRQLLFIGQRR